MTTTTTIDQMRRDLRIRAQFATNALMATSGITVLILAAIIAPMVVPDLQVALPSFALWVLLAAALASVLLLAFATLAARAHISRFELAEREIRSALEVSSSAQMYNHLSEIDRLAQRTIAVRAAKAHFSQRLDRHLDVILQREARDERRAQVEALCRGARSTLSTKLAEKRAKAPFRQAEERLVEAIASLKQQKAQAEQELDRQREKKWLKLWFDLTRPDFAEVEQKVEKLEVALRRLRQSGALQVESTHFDELDARMDGRIREIEQMVIQAIPDDRLRHFDEERMLRNATWLAAFSVPVSAWNDLSTASDIYDSLREVNGNYADLSDHAIWWETLTMDPDELAGLASLTKGAYFERLVEADTGGERFEHFNHPDTDIVVDGTAYQLKATDSVSYIDSVPDDIPVISTSEVADITGAIDSGYFNADLTEAVDLSLGGTLVDVGDTAVDAVLTGLGGVGILAILKGVWSGSAHYRETGDALEALSTGLASTAVSTARTAVNAAEILGRGTVGVVNSAPIRFAGRMMVSGVRKMDKWLEETPSKAVDQN